jgi:hypothetical protein
LRSRIAATLTGYGDAKAFDQIFFEAWTILGDLKLPSDHPLYSPKGFHFTPERKAFVGVALAAFYNIERQKQLCNRWCLALMGIPSTGKTTLLRTICSLMALLGTFTLPLYLDYSTHGPVSVKDAVTLSLGLRQQKHANSMQPFICADEFHMLFQLEVGPSSAFVRVVEEYRALPDSGICAILAGSSRSQVYFNKPELLPAALRHFPCQSRSANKYKPYGLLPLRTQAALKEFITFLITEAVIDINPAGFGRLTKSELPQDPKEQLTALTGVPALTALFSITAGAPGHIITVLEGGLPAECKLPWSDEDAMAVLLDLVQKNKTQSSTYDAWNPQRISKAGLASLFGKSELEVKISDLKDAGIIYELDDEQMEERYELCFPAHFDHLTEPYRNSPRITKFDIEMCKLFGKTNC